MTIVYGVKTGFGTKIYNGLKDAENAYLEAANTGDIVSLYEMKLIESSKGKQVNREESVSTMITIEGESFRCECGCGIFTKCSDSETYKCNCCPNEYSAE